MLSYYIHDGPAAFRFRLVGALAGAAAEDLEQCRLTAFSTINGRAFVVDIDDLTEIDESGRELLVRWRRNGAQFAATSRRARLLGESILGDSLPIEASRPEASGFRSFRFALAASVVLLALFLPIRVWAAGESPESVLDRYGAALENRKACGPVALDIEASLPKLAKRGRLQAIRHPGTTGNAEYEVVQSEGDRTVRQQVIARYLKAEAEAQAMPASAVAVSRANYKFRFVGAVGTAQNIAYVFQITPRKKRLGLIRGEVWIDAATGIAVHQSGHLVKRPSVFLRRVNVVQDTDLREGRPHVRITRLEVDTLLMGRAELTIREHPEAAPDRDATNLASSADGSE
jgi:hypothetical protein